MEQTQTNHDALHARLARLDFAIQELAMYLDSFPDAPDALDYYNKLAAERAEVAKQYTREIGPMTIFDNQNPTRWEWGQRPWPWQNDK